MFMKILVLLLLLLAPSVRAQDRFTSGEFKGFTKSPTEGEIVRLDEPVTLRRMTGTVVRSVGDESPLEGRLVEVRALNGSEVIGAAKTDSQGRFHIDGIHPGTYVFKVTTLGFQSVVGTVVISEKARKSNVLALRQKPGV